MFSKAKLKEILASDPSGLRFEGVVPDMIDCCDQYFAHEIPPGWVMYVAAPPYSERKWFASVTLSNGKPIIVQ